MKKIDVTMPLRIYDDRGKATNPINVKEILFEDDKQVLALLDTEDFPQINNTITFLKADGQVVNIFFRSWYAENYMTEELLKAKDAIRFFKTNSVNCTTDCPSLLIGDVAELINQILGTNITITDLERK